MKEVEVWSIGRDSMRVEVMGGDSICLTLGPVGGDSALVLRREEWLDLFGVLARFVPGAFAALTREELAKLSGAERVVT